MIVLNLCCDHEHLFEGWFASADAFASQCDRGMVSCPTCGSAAITRRPTAAYLNTGSARTPLPARTTPAASATPDATAHALAALRQAARGAEDVGERFPEEARRIHYGEADARSIRGHASGDDIGELLDEGILVLPVPQDVTKLQ